MKKTILTGLLISFTVLLSAQQKLPSSREVKTFLKSNTYIVLDNNIFGMWNTAIREAVDAHWNITPKRYINPDEFKEKKNYPTASFILEAKTYFNGQENLGVFKAVSIVLGKKNGNINTMPAIADFLLAYEDVDYDEYYYKLGIVLKFMQKHLLWLKENPDLKDRSVMNQYRKAKEHTKNKTLYLLKSEMSDDVNTLAEISDIYSGKVKFVTQEEIQEAVDTKNDNVILLHLVAPETDKNNLLCLKMLLGASDAKLYYFGFHKIKKGEKPGAFLKSDFEKIDKY